MRCAGTSCTASQSCVIFHAFTTPLYSFLSCTIILPCSTDIPLLFNVTVIMDPKYLKHSISLSSSPIYLSIVSDASFSPETFPKGAEDPPLLPMHTLPPCLFKPSLSISTSFMQIFLYTILPSYNWPFSLPKPHNFTHIHFLRNLFILFLSKLPNYLKVFFCTHCTTLHFNLYVQGPIML